MDSWNVDDGPVAVVESDGTDGLPKGTRYLVAGDNGLLITAPVNLPSGEFTFSFKMYAPSPNGGGYFTFLQKRKDILDLSAESSSLAIGLHTTSRRTLVRKRYNSVQSFPSITADTHSQDEWTTLKVERRIDGSYKVYTNGILLDEFVETDVTEANFMSFQSGDEGTRIADVQMRRGVEQ